MHSIRKERAVKGLPAAIAILLICSSFLMQGASTHIPPSFSQRGAIYYVATYGNDSNPGTAAQPWRTIQHAANVMVAGDTVFVRGGIYHEQVFTTRSGNVADGYITVSYTHLTLPTKA